MRVALRLLARSLSRFNSYLCHTHNTRKKNAASKEGKLELSSTIVVVLVSASLYVGIQLAQIYTRRYMRSYICLPFNGAKDMEYFWQDFSQEDIEVIFVIYIFTIFLSAAEAWASFDVSPSHMQLRASWDGCQTNYYWIHTYTLLLSHIYGLPIQPALPALPAQPTIQLASPPECQIYSTISVTIWLWRWLQLPIRIKLSACVCLPQSFSPSSLVWVRLGIIIIIYYYYYYYNCSLQQQKQALFVCQKYTYITKVVYPSRRAWLTYMVGSVNVCVYH